MTSSMQPISSEFVKAKAGFNEVIVEVCKTVHKIILNNPGPRNISKVILNEVQMHICQRAIELPDNRDKMKVGHATKMLSGSML